MNAHDATIDQIIKLKQQLRGLCFRHWQANEVFSWVWWLEIACVIIPFIIWWKVVDKKRLLEICVFGLIVSVSAVFLDVVGTDFVLWEYPIHILPQIPLLFPVDMIILPFIYMLLYQRYGKWLPFLLANTAAAALFAFGLEPLGVLIGQYKLIHWEYYYSFPIYILVAAFSKFVTEVLKKKQMCWH